MFQLEDIRSSWVGLRGVRIHVISIMTVIVTVLSGALGWLNSVVLDYANDKSFMASVKDKDMLYYLVLMAPIGAVLALIRGRSAAPTEILEPHWPGAKSLLASTLKQAVLGGALGTVLGATGCAFISGGTISRSDLVLMAETYGLGGVLAFGLAGAIISLITARAAGVRFSPKLALAMSLRSSLACFVGALLLSVPFVMMREVWFRDKLQNGENLLGNAFLGGDFFAWMGLFIALEKGGYFLLDHFVTRYLLYRKNLVPWDLVRFLDTAAERILLRKLGGGYMFVHRTLLEYFAKGFK